MKNMKKLPILIMLMLPLAAIAQNAPDTTKLVPAYQDYVFDKAAEVLEIPAYQEVGDYVFGKAAEVLEDFAAALEVPVTEVWRILVKQQIVNSIMYSFLLGLGFTSIAAAIKTAVLAESSYSESNKNNYNRYWNVGYVVALVPMCLLGFTCTLIGMQKLGIIFTGLINPEYGAIQEIIKML